MLKSKRRKLEEAERARQLEAQVAVLSKRLAEAEAGKAQKPAVLKHRDSWVLPNGGNPIPTVPPSDYIQLTPIVQPVPIVPYSTQLQPLFMYDDDDEE